MDIGKRLQLLRKKKGISVYRLSHDTGISTSHIINLENGSKNPSAETLSRLIEPLGITLSELFNEDGDISYLSKNERIVLDFFRSLPNESAEAFIDFIKTLK